MPSNANFHSWLGTLFGELEFEMTCLLADETALQFLVVWSPFESNCFGGYVRASGIVQYAQRTAPRIDAAELRDAVAHFHARFQDKRRLGNLMHGHENVGHSALLQLPFDAFTGEDKVFLLVFVIFRSRNNIFHGNKGVQSWLNYGEQIRLCVQSMQVLISDAEKITPTMTAEAT